MIDIFSQISYWGYSIAAFAFATIAIWQIHKLRQMNRQQVVLISALALTSLWALLTAVNTPFSIFSALGEVLRNLGWIGFMYVLLTTGEGRERIKPVRAMYAVLVVILVGTAVLDGLLPIILQDYEATEITFYTLLVLRMIVAVGALVLVHNLYTVSAPETRWGIRLPMTALAGMWIYDLNLYTIAYLTQQMPLELATMRGPAMALIAPIFALAAKRNSSWKLRLSRTVAFQSFSLFIIGGYLVIMVVIANALQLVGGDYTRFAQITLVFGMSISALLLLPSAKFRAWFKVKIAKHLFQHRYDYRSEWMRFTDTIGRPGGGAAPFHERVVQAIADITDSPAGLLLIPDDVGRLQLQARWNWKSMQQPKNICNPSTMGYFQSTGRIIELDRLRNTDEKPVNTDDKAVNADDELEAVPDWMLEEPSAWVIVPLVHFERLAGLAILARPRINRTLDWEDLDMLRVVGRQVASYLAESQGQEDLSEARRFDEFNRRFAFIMHDIKNLVSQLSLLARNAERHADNPEFRVDMIETLQSSVGKMNGMLARLSQHNKSKVAEPKPMKLGPVVSAIVKQKKLIHNVTVTGIEDVTVMADPSRVEQILSHIVQNAIDASDASDPVFINVHSTGTNAAIEVLDNGVGMSGEFIRSQLFRPFASSKEGGFGIGAYEAQTLAHEMHGRIDVESREGEGSRFTLLIPISIHDIEREPRSESDPEDIDEKAA